MKHFLLAFFSLLLVTACVAQQKETSLEIDQSQKSVGYEAEKNSVSMADSGKTLAACLFMAAQTYDIPPAVLLGIYKVKDGEAGKEYGPLPDGSYDLGPMKINTSKLPDLAKEWEENEDTVRQWLKNDPCTNIGTAAYSLRSKLDESDDLADAIALYNEGTEEENEAFKEAVITSMREHGLGNKADTGTL